MNQLNFPKLSQEKMEKPRSSVGLKKSNYIIRLFSGLVDQTCFLGTFEEVVGLPGPLEASDETYTQSKFDISGSNETMQSALASIV